MKYLPKVNQLQALKQVARSGSINNNFSLGLSASWELDLWGKLSGAVDASRASAQASADDLAAARLSAQASVAQTYFSLRAAEAQMKYLQESLEAYEQSLNGAMGTLFIFYDLSKRLTLRGQTGENTGMDLIYTRRKD